jgi:CHAT domain-containing protein
MDHAELAAQLVNSDKAARQALLAEHSYLTDSQLAYSLKDICLFAWSSHPSQALGAAESLELLNSRNPSKEVAALCAWTSGLKALINGDMEKAIVDLDDSFNRFLALNRSHTAAATQVSKVVALAMLGRYDEAIACGLRARQEFLAAGDLLAAGRIEHNIGNIHFRRDHYREAEEFQRTALERFLAAEDQVQITKLENSLALTLSQQHRIRDAEVLYARALERAEHAGLTTTQAEIESSIGTLALFQGRYDRALDFLERSRRKYADLDMPHVLAMTEQEIADAYLELNLVPEAAEIYDRVTPQFRKFGMRAEAARALAYHARAELSLGRLENAHTLLARARELYEAEGNEVGAAGVRLTEAQLFYARGDYEGTQTAIEDAHSALNAAGTPRRLTFAHWLSGEAARATGAIDEARKKLRSALAEAESEVQPDIVARCLTSLGLLAIAASQRTEAEQYFQDAVQLIEKLRAPLPAEEFRTAFFADKLVPYSELARLALTNTEEEKSFAIEKALRYVERARSRGLVDSLSETRSDKTWRHDSFEEHITQEVEELRYQLNYFYNQVNQRSRSGAGENREQMTALQQEIRERESRILELNRQLEHRGHSGAVELEELDLAHLHKQLGSTRALVEYTAIDGQLLAFVVTDQGIDVVENLGSELELAHAIAQFRFQIDTLRYGSESIRNRLPILTERVRKHLQSLHARLFAPLESLVGDRAVVVLPYRSLHYLPFEALFDGDQYLIEQREVSYSPSAIVLQQSLARSRHSISNALLLGVADEQTPLIHQEIEKLAQAFVKSRVFLDDDATVQALTEHAPQADLIHLACHAQFRSDNPLFSSLRLGDGWLTVRDSYGLQLNCQLVTLSACETGLNALAPGDELIGLARGFFSAGAPSVLLSLWTVDDEATAQLMADFYSELGSGESLSQTLRSAQLKALRNWPHPFFWAPFVLMGRW